jgi:hypothetical protein
MVYSEEIKKKILSFVQKEPRTINDIAHLLGVSWLTADAYVERIRDNTGLLSVKKFRGGTRGALKIVYWNYIESLENEELQKELFEKIRLGMRKDDFDPMDIYQYIDPKKKRVFAENYTDVHVSKKQNLVGLFRSAEQEILCFSGNISWINVVEGKNRIIDILAEVAQKKVPIRIMGKVDITSIKNIDIISKMNHKLGREAIEVRHRRHPLRGFIIDSKVVRLKEEKPMLKFEKGELDYNTRLFYEMFDEAWVDWLKKVFWALYRNAIPAERRIKELEMV